MPVGTFTRYKVTSLLVLLHPLSRKLDGRASLPHGHFPEVGVSIPLTFEPSVPSERLYMARFCNNTWDLARHIICHIYIENKGQGIENTDENTNARRFVAQQVKPLKRLSIA